MSTKLVISDPDFVPFAFQRVCGEIARGLNLPWSVSLGYVTKTTGTFSSGATSVTSVGSMTNILPGLYVSGPGIAKGTTVVSVGIAASTLVLSQATTAAGTAASLVFRNPAETIQISMQELGVRASGTVTFTGTGAANDTILINGVTLTASAGAPAANQWQVGASATASALNLANAIIAATTNTLISGQVEASSSAGVVTIRSLNYGVFGNAVTLAEGVDSGNAMAVSGARLTGGLADAALTTYYL